LAEPLGALLLDDGEDESEDDELLDADGNEIELLDAGAEETGPMELELDEEDE
jgi:hypothetical protein